MTASNHSEISFDEFKQMADRAGLNMTTDELQELKPLYDLYGHYTYPVSYTHLTLPTNREV